MAVWTGMLHLTTFVFLRNLCIRTESAEKKVDAESKALQSLPS